jgi:DNA replication and repair protein RecF
VFIKELLLNNFRCFKHLALTFDSPVAVLYGHNGSGKTSLLEAIYYIGYLNSFRTHNARELIHTEHTDFFIKASVEKTVEHGISTHELQVGFSDKKRVVRIDKKAIVSYKELIPFYRVVAVCEDDIFLIKGEPAVRRAFLDQTSMFINPENMGTLRNYRTIAHNRAMLLAKNNKDAVLHSLWTEQLWDQTRVIQQQRSDLLAQMLSSITTIGKLFFDYDFALDLVYTPKVSMGANFNEFQEMHTSLFAQEMRYGRSLFGAHLDDFSIVFNHKKSRIFASRGQQKCAALLLKLAQLSLIKQIHGKSIMLLDDFMTDFDAHHMHILFTMLTQQGIQLIFTAPTQDTLLAPLLQQHQAQNIIISN